MKRSKETKPVHQFSASLRQGFCLGCGGKTRKGGGPGKQRDSFNWHRNCYRQFYRLWTKGMKYRRKRCLGCGKTFEAIGQRYHSVTCSDPCYRNYRMKIRFKNRTKEGQRTNLSQHQKVGFCLGCGGKPFWVKDQEKLTGKQGDSVNWHTACYRRLYTWWTRDLNRSQGYEHTCLVCRTRFTSAGPGAWRKSTCSEECRKEHLHRLDVAWHKTHSNHPFMLRQKRRCVECGKSFLVGGGLRLWNKITCSPICQRERKNRTAAAWHKAHQKTRTWERTCVICGKPFTASPMGWKRKTCSIACHNELGRRLTIAWRESRRG